MTSLFTLANICAAAVLVSLTAYVVLAGADFGGGVWDFLASGERKREQRELIAHAIGPVWEANHVWLVLVVVLLFTCFPPAFALLSTELNVPLGLMLIGIVLRGCAFAFRAYDVKPSATEHAAGRIFAGASVITPLILGICVGAIASGSIGKVSANAGTYARFFAPWIAPFPIACGIFALTLFTFLAAVYLTVDAGATPVREDFRTRALLAAVAVFVAAFGALGLAYYFAPDLHKSLMTSMWTLPQQLATGAAAVVAIAALWLRHYIIARVAAATQATLILWGWAMAQYPAIIPGRYTIDQASAPRATLVFSVWALVAGSAVLFPSLWYLFRLFKTRNSSPG
ncbi:MAG: cytochrome d ubiquinol oxidase subunit II [Gemmatimonadaceae bacterium]